MSEKFICNLSGAEYRIEKMNLLELRNEIIKQEKLTEFDILAGYKEKSRIRMTDMKKYDIDERDSISAENIPSNWGEQIEKIVHEEEKKIIDKHSKKLLEINEEIDMQLEKLRVIINQEGFDIKTKEEAETHKIPMGSALNRKAVPLKNIINSLNREKEMLNFNSPTYKPSPEKLREISQEILGDGYEIKNRSSIDGYNLETVESIVEKYDYREAKQILSYLTRSPKMECDKLKALGILKGANYYKMIDKYVPINSNEELKYDIFKETKEYGLFKRLDIDEVISSCECMIKEIASKKRTMHKRLYNQEVEISPISININNDNKAELIDGYKRLLYINDEELQNIYVPIKVYNDIDDLQFFNLMYSSNAWKSLSNTPSFHDRGFLFGIRQRFGIKFEDYFNDSDKDIPLLQLLSIYDNTNEYYLENEFLVKDLESFKGLQNVGDKGYKDENNRIHSSVIRTFITCIGAHRRRGLKTHQQEIKIERMIDELYENKDIAKKLKSKEKLSIDGHIENFMREHINNEINRIVIKHLYASQTVGQNQI